MELRTPVEVVRALREIRDMSDKGLKLLAERERELVMADLEVNRVEALAYLEAQGTVEDRKQIARLAGLECRQAAELLRVEVSRIKLKLKQLSENQMSVQTSARMIELEWRG